MSIVYSKKLTAYDYSGAVISDDVPYIEVQWNRKFFEVGNFSIYMRKEDFDSNMMFFQLSGRSEWGLRFKYEYEDKTEGEFITISGYFAEYALKWTCHVLQEQWECPTWSDRTWGTLGYLFNIMNWEYKVFKGITWSSSLTNQTAVPIVRGKTTYELAFESMMKYGDGASIRVSPVFETDSSWTPAHWTKINIQKFTGISSDVVFSKPNKNIKNLHFSKDDSGVISYVRAYFQEGIRLNSDTDTQQVDYKTYNIPNYSAEQQLELKNKSWFDPIIVLAPGFMVEFDKYWLPKNAARNRDKTYSSQIIECYAGGGKPLVCSSDINPTTLVQAQIQAEKSPATEASIYQSIQKQAKEEARLLAEPDMSITGSPIPMPGYMYNTDYGLGSNVTVIVPEIGSFSCQITEASEVHHKNTMDLTVNFANPKLIKTWKPPLY